MKKAISLVLLLAFATATAFAAPVQPVPVSPDAQSGEITLDADLFGAVNGIPLTVTEMEEVEGGIWKIICLIIICIAAIAGSRGCNMNPTGPNR